MESKTKHRILGIIVMAGIAVLTYPILQAKTDILPDQQLVKAPPFPDQSIQVSAAIGDTLPDDFQIQGDSLAAATIEPVQIAETTTSPGAMSTKEDHDQCVIIDIRPPSMADASDVAPPEAVKPVIAAKAIKKKPKKIAHKSVKNKKHKRKVAKHASKAKKPLIYSKISHKKALTAYKQQSLNDNGLLQLKKAAWVIQLGSFKHKSNALKLVNKLRSKGYRAFIQKYSAATGEHTRVFVGPEHQQKSARIVAAELHKGMKLRGIVISYKPFTL